MTRDANGYIEGVHYEMNEADGTVNWEKMIPEKFIVALDEKNKNADLSTLKNNEKLILLAGFKHLLKIRGYNHVAYDTLWNSDGGIGLKCMINFIGNAETEGRNVVFESTADATMNNTKSVNREFLTTCAENRAFCRCIRNFLGINILSKDEMGEKIVSTEDPVESESESHDPGVVLADLMKKVNVSFEILKERMIKDGTEGAELWTEMKDIPKALVFSITGKLQKRLEKLGQVPKATEIESTK